ncbi:hypothetical protein RBB50_001951 [Rhinocladiella similis]
MRIHPFREQAMTQMEARQCRRRPMTWYRDGFIVTEDVSPADFEKLRATLALSSKKKRTDSLDANTKHLVLLTPTPLEGESSLFIGYVRFKPGSSARKFAVTDAALNRSWRNQGLEDWMLQCAREWSDGQQPAGGDKR